MLINIFSYFSLLVDRLIIGRFVFSGENGKAGKTTTSSKNRAGWKAHSGTEKETAALEQKQGHQKEESFDRLK